jgi:hypothetical protein
VAFRIADDTVEVCADRRRRLAVLDPTGREMLISVGAAVFTVRLAIRHEGWIPDLVPPEATAYAVQKLEAAPQHGRGRGRGSGSDGRGDGAGR